MKTKEELQRYQLEVGARDASKKNVLIAHADSEVSNACKMARERAPQGFTWVDYWRALTGNYECQLKCGCCGKIIFIDEVPKIMANMYALTGDTPEAHKAIGGHILIKGGASYDGGKYIMPLCQHCYNQQGEKIKINKGTIICKVITED